MKMHVAIRIILGLVLLEAPFALTALVAQGSTSDQEATAENDLQIQADLAQELDRHRFKDIHVSVDHGVVDLTGTVQLIAYKEEADRKAHQARIATAVRNRIRISDCGLIDQDLQARLMKRLEFERVGYGTTTFNAISVRVRQGTVILSGHAYSPMDKYFALSLVSYTPGAQDVIDEIEVDPPSPMDDRIRVNVARAIYGFPPLMKYSIDPGRPIRISVQNGNVTLYGVVDNAVDRDTASIRANGVQGVFKVTNELQVAATTNELD